MKKPLQTLTALLLVLATLAGCGATSGQQIVNKAMEQFHSSGTDTAEPATPTASAADIATPIPVPTPTPTAEPEPLSLTEGVTLGRSVFLHENGVAFWGSEEVLCSALVDSRGMLYDFYAEGTPNTYIWGSAILGTDYYMATSDGFFQFSLPDLEQGDPATTLLCEDAAYDGFTIYDGAIYFQHDDELRSFPLSGGAAQVCLSGIQDYEVTNQGIFYTNKTDGLYLLDPATGNSEKVISCPASCRISLLDDTLYLWAGREVLQYCRSTGETRALTLAQEPDLDEHIWPGPDYLLYTATSGDVYVYDLSTNSETYKEHLSTLPDKGNGQLQGSMLYYVYASTVYWDDVVTGETGSESLSDFLPDSTAPESTSFSLGNHLSAVEYDSYIDVVNDYFMLTMPKAPAWEAQLVSDDVLEFYYVPARESGYDGCFLTIMAEELSKESSLSYPAYSIAGRDSQKLYVALFPTDVRYDTSSSLQQTEFNQLLDYVYQISEGSVNSPFQMAR